MTTTIEIPDSVYDQVKSHAAQQGKTVEAFFVEAVHEKLADEQDESKPGLMTVFGKGDKEAVAEVQRIID
jgi:hypothetical protein